MIIMELVKNLSKDVDRMKITRRQSVWNFQRDTAKGMAQEKFETPKR